MYKKNVKNALKLMAVCDALGYVFEFKKIVDPYDVVQHIAHNRVKISDDTQMTLFMFEQLYSTTDFSHRAVFDKLFVAYTDWFITQNQDRPDHDFTGLLGYEALYYERAPGLTCLASCEALAKFELPSNDSKGCGSVMRLLPFVHLIGSMPHDEIKSLARMSALMTHQHEENAEASDLFIDAAAWFITKEYKTQKIVDTMSELLDVQSITELGEGWTALECVRMGIWAAIHAKSLRTLLELSIAHPGDSDSTAAVAGCFFGMSPDTGMRVRDGVDHLYGYIIDSEIEVIDHVLNSCIL